MTLLLHLLLFMLAVPAVLTSLYLLCATLLSRRPPGPTGASRPTCFDIIVPAHDEAAVIVRAILSLQNLDWPARSYRVIVIADNCSDDTALRARAAGALVLERHDVTLRGKGHALAFGFQASRVRGWAHAVVVVDADTRVSPNLLRAFAARIDGGASAVQAHYAVLNAQDSWRTRLMAIALAAFHQVRSRARERLGLSCGLRGNGWCVTHALLRRVPYRAFSLAEDVEYGIELGLAGHRVHYADEASVAGLMVSGESASRSQRRRWEGGRMQLVRSRSLALLQAAWRRGSLVCLDLALDLLVPPLSYAVLNVAALSLLAALAWPWQPSLWPWLWVALACLASLVLHVLRGWQLSGVGLRGGLDLLRAPWFVAWKLLVVLSGRGGAEWVRTRREQPP